MTTRHHRLTAAVAAVVISALVAAGPSSAADAVKLGYQTFMKTGSYDDVRDELEEAIVSRGFVIDHVGHMASMLERTAEAAGSVTEQGARSPYENAQYFQFCPVKLTHELISANPDNIANCPIALFVYETKLDKGKIVVGFRLPVAGPSRKTASASAKLTELLTDIAMQAVK